MSLWGAQKVATISTKVLRAQKEERGSKVGPYETQRSNRLGGERLSLGVGLESELKLAN